MSKRAPKKKKELERPAAKAAPTFLLSGIACCIILGYGLFRAVTLRWICDDAFITMRYVKNFLDGNGLVYNIGERVEGYTHFLWLLLLSATGAIGFDPVEASQWLGIVSFAGILVLLMVASYREHKTSSRIWLPIAAALYALNYDNQEWASGGLETSFYTLLILAAFFVWFYSKFSERKRLWLVGLTLALISLTRPDGVLFTASAVLLLLMRARRDLRSAIQPIAVVILPSVVIGVPYLIWKYFYYGDLLPLTYYAKSGGSSYYWSQGLYYIWLFFRVHYVLTLSLIASTVLLLSHRNPSQQHLIGRGSPVLASAIASIIYLILFVAKSGGDFMFGRFIMPIVPLLLVIVEEAFWSIPTVSYWKRTVMAITLLIAFFAGEKISTTNFFQMGDDGKRLVDWNRVVIHGETHGIMDERWFYYDHDVETLGSLSFMDAYRAAGLFLEPIFRGLNATVAIPGAGNMIAYYANFRYALNEFGLTDSGIAHAKVTDPGHIGHEKVATDEYLRRRQVNLEIGKLLPELPTNLPMNNVAFRISSLGLWQLAAIITYDSALFHEIDRRLVASGNESRTPYFESIIPDYVDNALPSATLPNAEAAYEGFHHLYLDRYPDSTIERRFKERIMTLSNDSALHAQRTK